VSRTIRPQNPTKRGRNARLTVGAGRDGQSS